MTEITQKEVEHSKQITTTTTTSTGNLSALPDQFLKVYSWASKNTAETRRSSGAEDEGGQTSSASYKYFWPRSAKLLLESLQLSRGQLIALVGLSGVGKSSAQREIG
jgi:ABC-type transport system involved in cytochrome bd biosynthesis fused ATPase/permease subunit